MQEADASKLVVLLVLSALLSGSHLAGFVYVSRSTRSYAADELYGNARAARHTVLPAWRPLLVGCCQCLAVLAGVEVAALAAVAGGGAGLGLRTTWGGWAFVDLTVLCLLALDCLVPSIVAQPSVTVATFRRGTSLCAASLALNAALWACRVWFANSKDRKIASALLICASGLVPFSLAATLLTGAATTRVRLRSRTHRAAFVLVAAVCCLWTLCLGLRAADDPSSRSLRTAASAREHSAYAVAVLLLAFQGLLPVATYKTLVADTKFWRGLGRHNANPTIGPSSTTTVGLKLADLCAPSTRQLPGLPARETPPPPPERAEMGLAVASASLQRIVEEATRDRRLLEFDHLSILKDVLGRGATAHVYRGVYRGRDAVAVKAFNPAEITEDEVAQFGREAHLMASLRHRNVLFLLGLSVRPPQICAVFEFCERGELGGYMASRAAAGTWTLEARCRCAVDALAGLAYLHDSAVWHRDVKVENFLVSGDDTVKLCDFGESVRRSTRQSRGEDVEEDDDDVPWEVAALRDLSKARPRAASSLAAARWREGLNSVRSKFKVLSALGALPSPASSAGSPTEFFGASSPPTPSERPSAAHSAASTPRRGSRRDSVAEGDAAALVVVGTVAYMAPELVAASRDYTEAVDVYAAGVALRCVFAGETAPWPDDLETFDIFDRVERGGRPAVPPDVPAAAADLVAAAWRQDARARPSAAALRDRAVRALAALCGGDAVDRLRATLAKPSGRPRRGSFSFGLDALRASGSSLAAAPRPPELPTIHSAGRDRRFTEDEDPPVVGSLGFSDDGAPR